VLNSTYNLSPLSKSHSFKAYKYFVAPLVKKKKSLICKCHEVHIVTFLHFLNILSLALVHPTVLVILTTLKNSCANEAAYGSREKENWQDISKNI